MKEIDNQQYRNIYKGRIYYHHTKPLIEFLEKSSIKYAVLKGEPLSLLAYGKNGQRSYDDMDILISKNDAIEVSKFLLDHGYEYMVTQKNIDKREMEVFALSNSHQLLPFVKVFGQDIIEIDLNFDVIWGEENKIKIDILSDFLNDTIQMKIFGSVVQTLPPLKAFLQLVLHHYKHMNSIYILVHNDLDIKGLCKDIYYLLINQINTITVNHLYELAEKFNIVPYIYYVLYLTQRVYNDERIKPYLDQFQTERGKYLLNCYGLNEKERKQWKIGIDERISYKNYVYELMKEDLTKKDYEKIIINKYYMG